MSQILLCPHLHCVVVVICMKNNFLFYSSPAKGVIIKGILFEDQCIRFSELVENVGVQIDQNLGMDNCVTNIVPHYYKILKDIESI